MHSESTHEWIVLRAARDLREGDEACHYYCDVRMPRELRRSELASDYGFECRCPRCTMEEKLNEASSGQGDAYARVYSCALRPTSLEERLKSAEEAMKSALSSTIPVASISASEAELWRRWADFPLAPALGQCAEKRLVEGRHAESIELWDRVAQATESVLPLSNVYLRVVGQVSL